MSRNGSGTYTLPAGNPVVTGTTISSTWANNTLQDISTALTGSLASDGQTTATGNLKMGANRITGLADGLASTDAATKSQVDTAIAGLGTMATQNANNVAITGGTINGTTVGATTPTTVKTTALTVTGATSGNIAVVAPAVAGTNTLTLPAATGTILTTVSSGTTGTSMVLIGNATASNSATIDFTGLPANTYNSYRLYVDCAVPVTNAVTLLLRVSSGGVFQTSGYKWQNWRWTTAGSGVIGSASAAGIALNADGADNIANTANNGGSFVIDFYNPSQSSDIHKCNIQGFYLGSTELGVVGNGFSGTDTIDGFRFLMSSGNISTGRFSLYGIKNA